MRFKEFMQREEAIGASSKKFGVMGQKPAKTNPVAHSVRIEIQKAKLPKPQKTMSVHKRTALKPARPSGDFMGTIKSVL